MVTPSPKQTRGTTATSVLKRLLEEAGVLGLVRQQPDAVQLPELIEVKAPFAYQNGAYNYIDPVRLEGETNDAFQQAASYAVKGQWLARAFDTKPRKKQLVVVGDLSSQPDSFAKAVHDLMREHKVPFYDMEELGPLFADIRKSAADHGTAATFQ